MRMTEEEALEAYGDRLRPWGAKAPDRALSPVVRQQGPPGGDVDAKPVKRRRGRPEEIFKGEVIEAARLHGWRVYHTHDSRRSEPGYPDLALVHPVRCRYMLWELKVGDNGLSKDQAWWLWALGMSGLEVAVWWPSDWDTIIEHLTRR